MKKSGYIKLVGRNSGFIDQHPGKLAAKNMIHHCLMNGQQENSMMKRMHFDLCSRSSVTTSSRDAGSISILLERVNQYQPDTDHQPCFIRDLQLMDNGKLFCLDQTGQKLISIDFIDGPKGLSLHGAFSSVTHYKTGFLALSADAKTVYIIDKRINLTSTHPIEGLRLEAGSTYVDTTDNGVVFTDVFAKRVVFCDNSLHLILEINLMHLPLMKRGCGFREGAVVLLTFSGRRDFGELVWVSPSGDTFTILGGLKQPVSVKCRKNLVYVCDLTGLYLLAMDGLAVVRQQFFPWKPMLQELGIECGYGFEVIEQGQVLIVIFKHVIPGIPQRLNYSIVEFRKVSPEKFIS
jgi:hypothetical protein